MVFSIHLLVHGQDREMERTFQNKRQDIIQSKIKVIREYKSQSFSKCSEDSYQTRQYGFDENGNLNLVLEFDYKDTFPSNMISYKHIDTGEYIEKKYTFLDKLGNIKYEQSWKFEYDNNAKKVKELLISPSGDTILSNVFDYDPSGNLTSQIRVNFFKWTFTYNYKGQMIERREWTNHADSFKCIKLISYNYDDSGLILSKIETHPDNPSDIWQENHYTYNNKKLTAEYEIKTFWVKSGNKPQETKHWHVRFEYEYDDNGNLLIKSEFRDRDEEPISCLYYQYEYYEQ